MNLLHLRLYSKSLLFIFYCSLLISITANAQLSGSVYKDFNSNGRRDLPNEVGLANVVVSAYTDLSVNAVTTTSDVNGSYSFTAAQLPSGTKVRLEFTQLDGYFAGVKGPQSQSTIQFVTAGVGSVASLGILDPREYCGLTDIQILTSCYVNGNPLGGGTAGEDAALVTFPATANGLAGQDGAPSVSYVAKIKEVGSVWGLSYQASTKTFFIAALVRRHSGLGPLGTGGIYKYDDINKQLTNFLNLKNLGIDTGPDPHLNLPADKLVPNEDSLIIHHAGKVGIGGITLSRDEKSLFVVNLYDKRLYRINVGVPAVAPTSPSAVRVYNIPDPTGTGESRPWAVSEHRGKIYVGVVNSAQLSQDSAKLKAYIYQLNEVSGEFTEVFQMPLNYKKGAMDITANCIKNDHWFPWIDKFPQGCATFYDANLAKIVNFAQYPQPLLSSIAFDGDGSLLIGFMDRFGLMSGYRNLRPKDDGMLYDGFVGGDLLRAQYDPFSKTYTLESNGISGDLVGIGTGNGEGPGGGEFFGDDYWKFFGNPAHLEILNGGILSLPDQGEIVVSAMDPVHEIYQSGGMRVFDRTTGKMKRAYALYSDEPGTLGKSGGVGEIKMNCEAAAIEMGNRIWNDKDFDGIQDPSEEGIPDVIVTLHDMSKGGALVATDTTSSIGTFCFNKTNAPLIAFNTDYEIRVAFNQNTIATGKYIKPALKDKDNSIGGDERDSDGVLIGDIIVVSLNSGSPGQTSHNNDIGLIQCIKPNGGNNIAFCEPMAGTDLLDAGSNQKWSFIAGPATAKVDSLTGVVSNLTANGNYTFALIFSPAGLSCSDTITVTRKALPDGGVSFVGASAICIDDSSSFKLTAITPNGKWAAVSTNPSVSTIDSTGKIAGLTKEGLYKYIYTVNDCPDTVIVETKFCLTGSIGNFVWLDKNRNGIQDSGEVGINGVIIELYKVDASGNPIGSPIAKDTTDANGMYSFSKLPVGSYKIKIIASSLPSLTELSNKKGVGSDPTKDSDINDTFFSDVISISNTTPLRLDIDAALQATCVKPNAGIDVAFCAPQLTYDLANASSSQYWKFISGPKSVALDSLTGQIGGMSADGIYKFMLVYKEVGTTCSDTISLTRNALPNAGADLLGETAGICSSLGTVQLNGMPLGGTWSVVSTNPSIATISTTGLVNGMSKEGVYSFAYTVNNCTDTIRVEAIDCEKGSIGNFVWFDKDRDGIQDGGELGVSGVIIELYKVDASGNPIGSPIAKDTTDTNGMYMFSKLPAGSYKIKVVSGSFPALTELSNKKGVGSDPSKDSDINSTFFSDVITINSTTLIRLDVDAALQATCVKPNAGTDFAFCAPQSSYNLIDAQTGQFWKFILGPKNVVLDSLTGQIDGMTSDGTYRFMLVYNAVGSSCSDTVSITRNALPNAGTDLTGSTNGICRSVGSVQLNGLPTGGTWTALSSNPVSATISTTGLVNGMTKEGIYTFVYRVNNCSDTVKVESIICEKGQIGDRIWLDKDDDGIQDAGEKGIPNVILELYKVDINGNIIGNAVAKDTTGTDGKYLFSNLPDGVYKVKIVVSSLPADNVISPKKDIGSNDAIDSDFSILGLSHTITINNATLQNSFLTVDGALNEVCKQICVPYLISKKL